VKLFERKLTALRFFLSGLLLLEAVPFIAHAEDEPSSIENVHFEGVGDLVFIYYDLVAPIDRVHRVSVELRRESDSLFVYRPLILRGDVGAIVIPGQKRRIIWDFPSEYPQGLPGDDFYFVVRAEPVESRSTISPYVWIGGGAAVVGGLLALILSGGGDNGGGGGGGTQGFPPPPGRP
jgi:hypothetical protein